MTQDTRPPRFRFGLRFAMLARAWRRTLDAHLAQVGLTIGFLACCATGLINASMDPIREVRNPLVTVLYAHVNPLSTVL